MRILMRFININNEVFKQYFFFSYEEKLVKNVMRWLFIKIKIGLIPNELKIYKMLINVDTLLKVINQNYIFLSLINKL